MVISRSFLPSRTRTDELQASPAPLQIVRSPAAEVPAIATLAPLPRRSVREISIQPLATQRGAAAKKAFTTRMVPRSAMRTVVSGRLSPISGDLVLARVDRLGQHARLELPEGRKARMHEGDEIIVAYGDRYAPDQFEAHVPPDLGPTQLVASGGVASRVLSKSGQMKRATDITPIGLIADDRGVPLNLLDFALEPVTPSTPRPRTVAVVGTSMNSGKTTTIRYLVNGLGRAQHSPGATKVTGTGSGGDYWVMMDAGAHKMLDFTDVGFSSTYRMPFDLVARKLLELIDHLTVARCGVILVEVADGLYQRETERLIDSEAFRSSIDGVIFAAGDAMGAAHGVSHLLKLGLPVIGVSGRLTGSPLAAREAAAVCSVPIFGTAELRDPVTSSMLAGLAVPSTPREEPTEASQQSDRVIDLLQNRIHEG